jgi:lipoprotein-anchoring transpeptidase ErfK/SrfK
MPRPPLAVVAAVLSLSSTFAAAQTVQVKVAAAPKAPVSVATAPKVPVNVANAPKVAANAATVPVQNFPDRVVISVKDQKLMLVQNNQRVAVYPVSTSKYGLGDYWGHMTTPLGYLQVAQKIGDHAPDGAVFHNRRFTGEVLRPNAAGRDPVITRIIWLRGLEPQNAHAFNRCIYIHGTPEERFIGKPASYGCIRMKSRDVTTLYNELPIGALVQIIPDKLPKLPKARASAAAMSAWAPPIPQAPTVAQSGLDSRTAHN